MVAIKFSNTLTSLILVCALIGCNEGRESSVDDICVAESAGTYPKQSESPYTLPWGIGETYSVSQGNCTIGSHRKDLNQQFAYDFGMPVGTKIYSVRNGIVVSIEAGFSDGTGVPGEENQVSIEHSDGSVAQYIHITTNGVLVELGQAVEQNELIAMSGNSGNSSGPHLHFQVLESFCPLHDTSCSTMPVNFRNTSAHVNGLIEGKSYTAE